jgi:hypothetical protein
VVTQGVPRAMGWSPGRRVDILPWVSEWEAVGVHAHEARSFLEEFGGLSGIWSDLIRSLGTPGPDLQAE